MIEFRTLATRNRSLPVTTKIISNEISNEISSNEDRFHALLEIMNDVFWSFDLTGKNENFASQSAARRYNMPLAHLLARP